MTHADTQTVDPEMKAEFEEIQKKGVLTGSNGAASQIQNFDLAGFLSGSSKDSPAAPTAPTAPASGSSTNKRR